MTTTIDDRLDPALTRAALRGIECTFAAGVTHPAVLAALQDLNPAITDIPLVNYVTRSAPMGPVGPEMVKATFYNPNPVTIFSTFPAVWERATPAEYLAAQAAAFAPVLADGVASMDRGDLAELAALSRAAGTTAAEQVHGRALFAGLASLPWPDEDPLVVWHAAKLLREHRGDGHVALLVGDGLSGIDCLVVHAAFDGYPPDALRLSRRWDQETWDVAVADLRDRGWLTDDLVPTLSEWGQERRQHIEDRTNELAAYAFEPLGASGLARMTELGRTLTQVLGDADVIPAHYKLPPSSN